MQLVPWRYIADWKCIVCGECCKLCSVVLNFQEWLQIVKNFGVEQTVSGLDKLFIKRRADGSCVFLRQLSNIYLCGLQYMKPKACKIWPFKVLSEPRFGNANEAEYDYGKNRFFLYVDPMCRGIRYGNPSWDFASNTLKEFIEIAIDIRNTQFKTTANIGFPQSYAGFGVLDRKRFFAF